MICAALLGHEIAAMPADAAARLISLIRHLGPLPPWPKIAPAKILEAMRSDKKTRAGKLRFVLATRIGNAKSFDTAKEKTVLSVLRFMSRYSQQPESAIARRHSHD